MRTAKNFSAGVEVVKHQPWFVIASAVSAASALVELVSRLTHRTSEDRSFAVHAERRAFRESVDLHRTRVRCGFTPHL